MSPFLSQSHKVHDGLLSSVYSLYDWGRVSSHPRTKDRPKSVGRQTDGKVERRSPGALIISLSVGLSTPFKSRTVGYEPNLRCILPYIFDSIEPQLRVRIVGCKWDLCGTGSFPLPESFSLLAFRRSYPSRVISVVSDQNPLFTSQLLDPLRPSRATTAL